MNKTSPLVCPAPRVIRACENCREKRVRCLPGANSGSCRRCRIKGLRCDSRDKQAKSKTGQRTHISSQDQRPSESSTTPVPTLGFEPSEVVILPVSRLPNGTDSAQRRHGSFFESLFPGASQTPTVYHRASAINHTITQSSTDASVPDISDEDIANYLERYKRLSRYALYMPATTALQDMKQRHPFLLLGILSAMTIHDIALNVPIHSQFLSALAERTLVRGEENLDIVQGILVQLMWFPLHLAPQSRQFFQILQLGAGMIRDIHLYRHSADAIVYHREEARAYKAFSYLSSLVSVAFQRPNCLPTPDSSDQPPSYDPVSELHESILLDSSNLHLKLQRIAEDAENVRNGKSSGRNLGSLDLEAKIAMACATDFDPDEPEAPRSILYRYAQVQVHACLFQKQRGDLQSRSLLEQTEILAGLKKCLAATRQYFGIFLALPINQYRDLSFIQWTQLVQVIKFVPRLCFDVVDVPGWDAIEAREELQFGLILDSLCYRMSELTSKDPATNRPDHFLLFKSMLEILKEVYDQRCNESIQSGLTQPGSQRCPLLNGSLKESEFWNSFSITDAVSLDFDAFLYDDSAVDGDWGASIEH